MCSRPDASHRTSSTSMSATRTRCSLSSTATRWRSSCRRLQKTNWGRSPGGSPSWAACPIEASSRRMTLWRPRPIWRRTATTLMSARHLRSARSAGSTIRCSPPCYAPTTSRSCRPCSTSWHTDTSSSPARSASTRPSRTSSGESRPSSSSAHARAADPTP